MKHRNVVANFIFKWVTPDKIEQKVALFKRSTHPNIRSYQGKYAPISGSVEDDDTSYIAAAERELHEETQLKPHQDLVLEFCGKPFSFEDEKAQRSWTVYPFGWNIQVDENKIKIDWEHSEWEWFNPQQILNRGMADECVPNIHESLQRVYFGSNGMFKNQLVGRSNSAGISFLETIDKLKNDTENGARTIATETLVGLQRIVKCFGNTGKQASEYWHVLRVVAYHFIYSARPSMNAAISAAILGALQAIAGNVKKDELDLRVAIEVLATCIQGRLTASNKIADAFSIYVNKISESSSQIDDSRQTIPTINIFTISFSSTILAALKGLLMGNSLTVNLTIFESRPQCEGASLASAIIKSLNDVPPKCKLSIRLAPESHTALLLTQCQTQQFPTIVLVGADRITPSSHVVNKTGSAQLAALSKYLPGAERRRVVVLSEEDKIAVPHPGVLPQYLTLMKNGDNPSRTKDEASGFSELAQRDLDSQSYERHSSVEVHAAWPREAVDVLMPYMDDKDENVKVEVENIYFENIATSCIDVFIGENGEMSRDYILRKSIKRAMLEEEMFGDLYD